MNRGQEDKLSSLQPAGSPLLGAAGRPRHVVALAASSGGLAALSQILSDLPPDFPAPILVLQHLEANHRSWLAEILDRRTGLRVAEARAGEPLVAGVVLTAPPGQHLLVGTDGVLALTDTARVQYTRPSADVLFASLAESWGAGAIAVVLSGRGRDGADGVREIKRRGGTVIVQDKASAEYVGMPGASILTGVADRILPLERIAAALIELTGRLK